MPASPRFSLSVISKFTHDSALQNAAHHIKRAVVPSTQGYGRKRKRKIIAPFTKRKVKSGASHFFAPFNGGACSQMSIAGRL